MLTPFIIETVFILLLPFGVILGAYIGYSLVQERIENDKP